VLLSGSTTHPHHPTIPAPPEIAARRIPHDATVAREARLDARSSGREELITRVLDICTRRSGLPLVLLTGPTGIGRSQVLAQIRARLTGLHVSTADIRLSRVDRDFPSLVARIAAELGAPPTRGESASAVLQRLLTTLTGDRHLVVFLDDAHRLAPACLPAVNSALGALAGSRVTVVCAVRTPAVDTGMNQLRASGLVHEERLRPLTVSEVEHILTGLLGAEPAPGLASEIRDACRGIPALAVLHDFAQDGWQSMSADHANQVVTRAAALCLLHRWTEAHEQLLAERELWHEGDTGAAAFGQAIAETAGAVVGASTGFLPNGPAIESARMLLRALSIDAAPDRFDTLESTTGHAVRAARSGQWDHALELARSAIATASMHGDPPGQATMFHEIATILIARGQLNRARSVIEEARSRHLLRVASACAARSSTGPRPRSTSC
jgi:ATP/maltotriose-dependent transcriptional regulator MalT